MDLVGLRRRYLEDVYKRQLYETTDESSAADFSSMSEKLLKQVIHGIGLNNDANVADGIAVGSNATDRTLLDFLINRNLLDFDTNTIAEKEQ